MSYIKKPLRSLLCLVAAAAFLLYAALPVYAAAAKPSKGVIRVGFFAFDGYHNIDEDGTRSGYGYEFIQKLLRYNNCTAEYIGYDRSWAEMQDMLKNGEIDLLTSAQKTPAREEQFDFSEPIGTSSAILTVKAGNDKIRAGEYGTYNHMRVGIIAGNSRNDRFAELAQEKGFTYTTVTYDDMSAMTSDLQAGQNIDAIVTSNLRSIDNEWVLDKFATAPFYAMVKKGNTELLATVNYAIEQMNSNSVSWKEELFEKYYAGTGNGTIAFSSTERAYLSSLAEHGTRIKVLVHPDRAPYSYIENGVAKGIIPDVFAEVADRIGLEYDYVLCSTRPEYAEAKQNRLADVVLEARNDLSSAEDMGYKLTDPYMNISYALVEQTSFSGTPQTIATIKETYTSDKNFAPLLEGKDILYFNNLQECVSAVLSKKADACYMYDYSGQKFASENGWGNLQATTIPDLRDSLTFAVRTSDDYRLLAVLNKGVNSVAGDAVDGIIKANTDFSLQNLTPVQVLWRNPVLLFSALALCVAVLFLFTYAYQHRKNEKRVRAALVVAEQASKAKGDFMSRMSHEIRTPLNAIIGYMSIAQGERIQSDKVHHCLENSELAAKHLLSIINDVLDMSSIESGRIKIATSDYNLKQQLTTISSIFYNQAKNRDVDFAVSITGLTEERVVGDELRVNQVLMNLLSNAVKFTPENGSVRLEVTQLDKTDAQVTMRFTVADTGIGMSKEYLSRIFTPFEQESAGTAQKFGGTGLGLAISKNLTVLMNGTIDVQSEPNKGTTFTVTLPFGLSTENKKLTTAAKPFRKVRVMVVDDQADDCSYVKEILNRIGVKSDTFTDGEAAVRRFIGRQNTDYAYDLCILDWKMPNCDGLEIARQLREAGGDAVPIIIATAYDVTEIDDSAKSAGVNKVIAKPLFQSSLFDLLVSTFGKYEPTGGEETVRHIELEGSHMLLAEDNEMNTEIAVSILTKAGIILDTAVNGKEALDMFTASAPGRYDAILMDVQMPIMNGYEATQAIRASAHPQAKSIPIIAMTANAFTQDVEEALANGMDGHIAKPVDYEKLYRTLNACIAKSKEIENSKAKVNE